MIKKILYFFVCFFLIALLALATNILIFQGLFGFEKSFLNFIPLILVPALFYFFAKKKIVKLAAKLFFFLSLVFFILFVTLPLWGI